MLLDHLRPCVMIRHDTKRSLTAISRVTLVLFMICLRREVWDGDFHILKHIVIFVTIVFRLIRDRVELFAV